MIRIAFFRFVLALSYLGYGVITTLMLGFYFPASYPLKAATLLARERHAHTPHPLRVVR